MPELSSLVNDSPEWVTIETPAGEIEVAYHPARVTPTWLAKASGDEMASNPLLLPQLLAEIISDWDVVENGKTLTPDSETLASLPYPILEALTTGIGAAASSGSEEKNDSNASTEARPSGSTSPTFMGSPQNGIVSSPQPVSTAVPSGTS